MKYDMGGKKILFVNKNGESEALREILEERALPPPEVVGVSSQEDALQNMDRGVSLVILDALEVEHHLVVKRLQELNFSGSPVKFLVILPYREEWERESEDPVWIGLAHGIIRKPYNIHALENRVKDLLGCACSCVA